MEQIKGKEPSTESKLKMATELFVMGLIIAVVAASTGIVSYYENLCRHDKWLCMMYPRLKPLRDLLSGEVDLDLPGMGNEEYLSVDKESSGRM